LALALVSDLSATRRRGLQMAEKPKSLEALLQEAGETIEGIIRKKFRVSLSASDGRHENQNAIEFSQQIKLLLWEKLANPEGSDIRDVRGYAAVLTYNQCSQRIRYENPEWNSLKNRLRYFFNESSGYALWNHEATDLLCGFASLHNQQRAPISRDKLEKLNEDIWSILPASLRGKNIRQLKRNDWENLLDAIFNHLESPVELDELVNLVSDAFAVEDAREQSSSSNEDEENKKPQIEFKDPRQTPEDELSQRQYLRKLWEEIGQLKANQRIAYLLNFRDADGDIQLFAVNGIATLAEIGRVLNLTEKQFNQAWQELPLDEDTRRTYLGLTNYDEKFAALCQHIPIEDLIIAGMLGGERQQVINLRRLARDKLASRMKPFK
jgi:hypothetical protein